MRISYNWLKDYIDLKMPPAKVAETLTMAGLTVESIYDMPDDTVLEIEITANRPDWLSYIGVARELSALTGAKIKTPNVRPITIREGNVLPSRMVSKVAVKVENKKLCPRYTARVIHNVKVGESPAWLKARLEAMGLRPVNNIVDITNFCFFETGEPMHAFDLDKIDGEEIIVRTAKSGEKITGIDGVERSLDGSDLVIADANKPIAIAGIMGGLNTEVNYSTKNILLEAAYFDPIITRRTSRKLALSTESSYRFERKVDIANIPYSSGRATALIAELAGGVPGAFTDIGEKLRLDKSIELRYERMNSILGVEINPAQAKSILTALGLKIKSSTKDKLTCGAPGFRRDLAAEIDLIEEIARIYGYDNIPETIPQIVDQPMTLLYDMAVVKKTREILAGLGLYEIITYSLLGRKMLASASVDGSNIVEIANPLTSEQEVMRPSLIPGILNAALWNINRKNKNLKLFEIGKIYIKGPDNKFSEKRRISLGIAGESGNWAHPAKAVTFFDLKGVVETLFSELGISGAAFRAAGNAALADSSAASIEISGEAVGVIGEAASAVLKNFDIKEPVFICELCLDAILPHAKLAKRFSELPKYPSVLRDISVVVGRDVSNASLEAAMLEAAMPKLRRVTLIDRYEGKQIPGGKISLTYRLEYLDPDKTFEEKEVSALHAGLLRALDEKFGAKLR